ncbi:hypothetical protein NDU88_001203 [Pleurodeles waltl]|uniref:Uncharacterized protein n=1 Tax=Pleurodeles waltl TaxID=8319 RepID=A0AAV7LXY1_PLEWA|nr:hypothetical protein NDU88_001203 [Pleurodeles waltl]
MHAVTVSQQGNGRTHVTVSQHGNGSAHELQGVVGTCRHDTEYTNCTMPSDVRMNATISTDDHHQCDDA